MFAQFTGAILGSLLVWGSFAAEGDNVVLKSVLNQPAPGVTTGQAFLIEALLTFLLVIVVLETAVNKQTSAGNLAPVAIGIPCLSLTLCDKGWAVFLAHIVAIPFTGCGINPARSFGKREWSILNVILKGPPPCLATLTIFGSSSWRLWLGAYVRRSRQRLCSGRLKGMMQIMH